MAIVTFDVSSLNGTNGFVFTGPADSAGGSLDHAIAVGDVNGDGVADVMLSASPYNAADFYVVFGGGATGSAAVFAPSLMDGTHGFLVHRGNGALGEGGGDINGDGRDDLVFSRLDGSSYAGESWVLESTSNPSSTVNLGPGSAHNDFTGNGSGQAVGGLGDINGDGFDDFAVGDAYEYRTIRIVLGGPGLASSGAISSVSHAVFGPSGPIVAAGDINGDGYDDFIAGGFFSSQQTYVFYGSATAFNSDFNASSLNGTNGFALLGAEGVGIAAGDINGDGHADVVTSRPNDNATYVVFGAAGAMAPGIQLGVLNGDNGFALIAPDGSRAGSSVAVGDFNGDGYADVLVGAPSLNYVVGSTDSHIGGAYLVYGKLGGFAPTINLSDLGPNDGFLINGALGLGIGASMADINNDGFDDVLVGSNGTSQHPSGVYVIYGHPTESIAGGVGADILNGTDNPDVIRGLAGDDTLAGLGGDDSLDGGDGADTMSGGLGNDTYVVNNPEDLVIEGGGGGVDLILSSISRTLGEHVEDLRYVGGGVFVGTGNGLDNQISGGRADDTLVGLTGDDVLNGEGGHDTLLGGVGDDTLLSGDGSDLLNGGVGIDTASFAGANSGVRIDLTGHFANAGAAAGDILIGIENVQGSVLSDHIIGDDGANLIIGGASKDVLEGGAGDDTLDGGSGFDTLIGGEGADAASYADSAAGIQFDLANTDANRGDAQYETFVSIEGVVGSAFADNLFGDVGDNLLDGGEGLDRLLGRAGADLLIGGAGGDKLDGGDGNDRLEGGVGRDTLSGGTGDDTLVGGAQADSLTGGDGADTFVFNSVLDSAPHRHDVIQDLASDDIIDLQTIDADTTQAGDQAFIIVTAFDGHAGQLVLRYVSRTDLTSLTVDVDGDGHADMTILIKGDHHDFTGLIL